MPFLACNWGPEVRFYNEENVEIEIDGKTIHSVMDVDGELVGLFSGEAEALGAQRAVNIRKLLIKKIPVEGDVVYGCEISFEDGSSEHLFASRVGGEWMLESEELGEVLNAAQVLPPI